MKDIAPATLKTKATKENNISAEEFAAFFAKNNEQSSRVLHSTEQVFTGQTGCFEIFQCTEEEVLKVVNDVPTNKANGIDGIPIKAIKLGITELLKPLTFLINCFMRKGLPRELKTAIVLPIHKKGPTDRLENYRPISLLPCISKIAERLIANQLNNHLTSNNLLSDSQHGFRQKHSTCTGLLYITEYIRKELDKGSAVGIVALDLSKAFDSINQETP